MKTLMKTVIAIVIGMSVLTANATGTVGNLYGSYINGVAKTSLVSAVCGKLNAVENVSINFDGNNFAATSSVIGATSGKYGVGNNVIYLDMSNATKDLLAANAEEMIRDACKENNKGFDLVGILVIKESVIVEKNVISVSADQVASSYMVISGQYKAGGINKYGYVYYKKFKYTVKYKGQLIQ